MNLLISKLLNLAKSERMEEVVLVNNNLSKTVELSLLPFEGRTYEKDIKLSYEIEDNINILRICRKRNTPPPYNASKQSEKRK